jgi:hypothetical protein
MRVFIVGSLRHLSSEDQKSAFRDACVKLGEALARKKCTLVICSATSSTADLYVTQGAANIGGCSIEVYYPDRETLAADPISDPEYQTPYQLKQRYNNLKFQLYECIGGWRVVHLKALHRCDVIIAVGGSNRGTSTIIYSGEALGKPVVLIPSFSGSAESAWRDFKRYYTAEEQQKLQIPFQVNQSWEQKIVEISVAMSRKNQARENNFLTAFIKAIFTVFLFVCWFTLFWTPISILPKWSIPPLMLITASLSGSILRNILKQLGVLKTQTVNSNILIDGSLGLLLAFAIFLLPLPAGLLLNGQPAKLDTFADVQRVGGGLSTITFFAAVFIEEAWRRIFENRTEPFSGDQ